jgi:hypothetical protein
MLQEKDKKLFAKLAKYFKIDKNSKNIINDILELDEESLDSEFKEVVLHAMRVGFENGSQNEAFRLFKKHVLSNNLYWEVYKSVKVSSPTEINQNDIDSNIPETPNKEKEWSGEFVFDVPVVFVIDMDDIAKRLDKLNDIDIEELADEMDSIIDIEVPYNGFVDYDEEAAYETFVEEIKEFIK